MSKIEQIKRDIAALSPDQREELYARLDQHYSSMFDAQIEADVAVGRLDGIISHAQDEERNGRLKPL